MVIVKNRQDPIFHSMVRLSKPYVHREDCVDNGVNKGMELISKEFSDT
jgi:hypothetical protein